MALVGCDAHVDHIGLLGGSLDRLDLGIPSVVARVCLEGRSPGIVRREQPHHLAVEAVMVGLDRLEAFDLEVPMGVMLVEVFLDGVEVRCMLRELELGVGEDHTLDGVLGIIDLQHPEEHGGGILTSAETDHSDAIGSRSLVVAVAAHGYTWCVHLFRRSGQAQSGHRV